MLIQKVVEHYLRLYNQGRHPVPVTATALVAGVCYDRTRGDDDMKEQATVRMAADTRWLWVLP